MLKEILVRAAEDETRVAVLEDRRLVEFYIERSFNQRLLGNIYKGRVENVLPGMQAAFVNIGLEKNAFLYVEDVVFSKAPDEEGKGDSTSETPHSIQDVLKVGQEVLVQLIKEPFGSKGARVTTHITLPGRYVVLMPTVDYVGISRRIEDELERERLKKLAESVRQPGMGMIVRTFAEGISREELEQDVNEIMKLWRRIQSRSCHTSAPSQIHRDLELLQRIIRDLFTEDIDALIVNTRYLYDKVLEIIDSSPQLKNRVSLVENTDLFEKYNLAGEIEKALNRKVWLKSGGYIVIDETEALTVVDVNTGKFVGSTNLADTVLKTNLEAAGEIARQLRLRNIGGIIIIDFIDMEQPEHRAMVVNRLEEELKKDKTKANILGLTQLGLVEMTRKKVRQTLAHVLQCPCPYCQGTGRVLSEETVALKAKREIINLAHTTTAPALLVEAHPKVAALLIGTGGNSLRELEQRTKKQLIIRGVAHLHIEETDIRVINNTKEIGRLGSPFVTGEVIQIKIEEPHASNPNDGIARFNGFIIDVEGAGALIGEVLQVEITKVFRTYARARIVSCESP